MSLGIALFLSLVLLVANAFFVAAEFAIVAAKRHRLEERAAEGSRAARAAVNASKELSLMLAGAQLGITLCTLALGALAKPAVARLLEPLISGLGAPDLVAGAVAVVLSVSLVVFLHMVVGEMAPKSWAISHPESSAMMLAIPFRIFSWAMRPVLWLMNSLANVLLRVVGVQPVFALESAQTPAELQLLLSQSRETGTLAEEDHQILSGALRLENETVADVMFPFSDAVTITMGQKVRDIERISLDSGRSRLVVLDDMERVRGLVHVRDALQASAAGGNHRSVPEFLQPIPSLPTAMPLIDAVQAMRQQRAQLALVRNDHGTIVGITSLEDMLEQILGEFDDESDRRQPSRSETT